MSRVSFSDQLKAAERDTTALFDALPTAARALGMEGWLKPGRMPPSVGAGFSATLTAWHDGTARRCRHKPRVSRPLPVVLVGWVPLLVSCLKCLPEAKGLERHRCDQCGRVCADTPGDRVVAVHAVVGSVMFVFGLCPQCERRWMR